MVTTHCCLNSKEQPVAMATMFLVICSLGSCLTPVSADSPHVSPSRPETGGLGGADRKGSQSWWAAGDGCPPVTSRGQRIRSCRFLWSKGLGSEGPECPDT